MPDSRSVFPALPGNDRLKKILGGDILAGKLGHAYILEGPAGSGKHTAALAAAAALSCENRRNSRHTLPCGQCLVCRKIAEGVSPDVLFIRRPEDRASVGVEQIRALREDLYIAPNENEKKVYILEEADKMTAQAQNALLLSLEEPPPYVTFFLLTENALSLLETIRSRAPVLRMQLFGAQQIAELLKNDRRYASLAVSDPDHFAESVTAGGGALGRTKALLSRTSPEIAGFPELRADAMRFVSLLFTKDPAEASRMLLSLPKAREEVLQLLRLVLFALRDLCVCKKGADVPMMFFLSREESRALQEKTGLRRLNAAYGAVTEAYLDIQNNASVQTVCTSVLMQKY